MNGLEALDEIWGYRTVATLAGYVEQPIKKVYKKEFAIVKKELKDSAKYKKAIEILKGKGTYMVEIISAVCYYKTYDELLGDACPWCSNRDLNREEFDLLKEVLG